jgi:hypothetical protein
MLQGFQMNHEEAQPKSRPAVSSKARLPTGITRRAGKSGNAYQVRVRMTGLPTLTKTFGKLEDARAWKSKVESSLNAGEPVITAKAGRYTIHEALTDYSKYADGVTAKKRYSPPSNGLALVPTSTRESLNKSTNHAAAR